MKILAQNVSEHSNYGYSYLRHVERNDNVINQISPGYCVGIFAFYLSYKIYNQPIVVLIKLIHNIALL